MKTLVVNKKISIPGGRIKEARLAKGLSQEKLGVLIGIDESTASARISRYESGIHEPPIATAVNISKALDVPLAFLYCEHDDFASLLLQLAKLTKSELQSLYNKLP